jgi:AcrR family transcriptional regulator
MEKDSRVKLIDTATRLFAEKGFAEVSIRELAKEADVNSALIAYYFGGKEGLYQAVIEDYLQRIEERFAKVVMSHLSPIDKLTQFLNNLVTIHREMPYLRKFLSREFIKPTPVIENAIKKYISRFYNMAFGILEEAVDQGAIRTDLELQFMPIAAAGMIHFYFMAEPIIKQMTPVIPGINDEQMFFGQLQEIFLKGILRRDGDMNNSCQ